MSLFTYQVAVLMVLETCVVVHEAVQFLEALVFLLRLEGSLPTLMTGYKISNVPFPPLYSRQECAYFSRFWTASRVWLCICVI